MYVLVYQDHVINGPRPWNYQSFENTLKEDLEIDYKLPVRYNQPDIIIVNDDTKIYPAAYVDQHYNTKIQRPVDGPWWDFTTGIALGSFTIGYKSLDQIKDELKATLKELRYNKEIAGTTTTIRNQTIKLNTSREVRNTLLQKYIVASITDTVNWKFGDTFITLNREELKTVISAIDVYVQSTFDWEFNLVAQIDSCTTPEQLDNIKLE